MIQGIHGNPKYVFFSSSISLLQISVKRGRSLKGKIQNSPCESLKINVKSRSKSQYDTRKKGSVREKKITVMDLY